MGDVIIDDRIDPERLAPGSTAYSAEVLRLASKDLWMEIEDLIRPAVEGVMDWLCRWLT